LAIGRSKISLFPTRQINSSDKNQLHGDFLLQRLYLMKI
jgi:hypothetical protein